jgi:signal peptidase I
MKLKLLIIFMTTVIVLTGICLVDDIRLYRIVSPSMEPLIPVGSLVVVSRSEPVEIGDIVAYKLEVMGRSYTLVHRVVDVKDGYYTIRADVDPTSAGETLEAGKILGKVVLAIPFLGYIAGVVAILPAIILLIPLASKKDGIGFPTAAFISFLPLILPVQGLASSIGQIPFTALIASSIITARIILEKRNKDIAELVYLVASTVSIISINVVEMVGWLAT